MLALAGPQPNRSNRLESRRDAVDHPEADRSARGTRSKLRLMGTSLLTPEVDSGFNAASLSRKSSRLMKLRCRRPGARKPRAHVNLGRVVAAEVPALPGHISHGAGSSPLCLRLIFDREHFRRRPSENELAGSGPLLKSGCRASKHSPTDHKQKRCWSERRSVLGGPQPAVYVVVPAEKEGQTVRPVPAVFGSPATADSDCR